ncbi:MAG: acyl-CoA reductase [Chitinophagaceae bacterium]
MNLKERIKLLVQLGQYMTSNADEWQATKQKAFAQNNWFTIPFIDLAVKNIASEFLQENQLQALAKKYAIPENKNSPKKIGLVLAGNIPMVGFHDLLCVFITGHLAYIKTSSKDEVLISHIVNKLIEWNNETASYFKLNELLKKCDAYIATGSNNTSRYFEYYFRHAPHIIRKNRTSVAILTGQESQNELEDLADDVHLYFGLGCRNVTKLYVPNGYDFTALVNAFKKYNYFLNHNKYKNNYDYNLAVSLLNHKYYMTSGSTLLVKDGGLFSPISQLYYEFYDQRNELQHLLGNNESIQCMIGKEYIPFGEAQCPQLFNFADGVDTVKFLMSL